MYNVVVLMSSYNGEKFIREQIESIITQNECNIKLIVRDDGSTDKTKEILDEYKEKGLLNWYAGNNVKPALSFMELLYKSPDADFYAFSDQDDIWDIDKLSIAVKKLMGEKKEAFYHSNARLVNENGIFTGCMLHSKKPKLNFYTVACSGGILGCTMVLNKKLRDKVISAPFPKYVCMHDFYIGMVCMGIGGKEIYDNKAHISYRQHANNVFGVAVGIKNKIRNKIKEFNMKLPSSIADQAQDVLRNYGKEMMPQYIKQCRLISKYKESIINTLRVSLSPKTHYSSIRNSMFIRICILLRRK